MRVFKRVDKKGESVVEVWKEKNCEPTCSCRGKNANCSRCDGGWLPKPSNKEQPLCEPIEITLSAENVGVDEHCVGRYQYFAHGNYNLVYRSSDQNWVLKISIEKNCATDSPERAVRLWNTINFGYLAKAKVIRNSKEMAAWVAPFIQGTQPTQKEIAQKILEIYESTGRIVVDAFVTSNFVKTKEGSIVCIDVGNAFFLESRPELQRVHSQVSLDTWNKGDVSHSPMSGIYRSEFFRRQQVYLTIVVVTKALLCLQKHRPDFRSVSTMLRNSFLINLLASHYDAKSERSEQLSAKLDEYIASCINANAQFASAALSVSPSSSEDDELFKRIVSPSTEDDTDTQDQSEHSTVDSDDISPRQATQEVLPAAWLGPHLGFPKYDPSLFPVQFKVQEQVESILSKFNRM